MQIIEFGKDIFGLYKPAGWTPLQALGEFKKLKPELVNVSLTYAGRLDPMAEGLLLVLAGERVHEKEKFLGLDKTYDVTALLGVETDSWDLLGIPNEISISPSSAVIPSEGGLATGSKNLNLVNADPSTRGLARDDSLIGIINTLLQSYIGATTLPLPPFSSPPHQGKPLFWWAKQGVHVEKERTSNIYSVSNVSMGEIASRQLLDYIEQTIPLVDGDFRQQEIIPRWKTLLELHPNIPTTNLSLREDLATSVRPGYAEGAPGGKQSKLDNNGLGLPRPTKGGTRNNDAALTTVTFHIRCASGTYIRSLVHDLGKKLQTGACVYTLKRTHIGQYHL